MFECESLSYIDNVIHKVVKVHVIMLLFKGCHFETTLMHIPSLKKTPIKPPQRFCNSMH